MMAYKDVRQDTPRGCYGFHASSLHMRVHMMHAKAM
jgi:hypothetical protein